MSYCLNPDCHSPGDQKSVNPSQAKFCSNCGALMLLCDRYRAIHPIGQGGFGRTFYAVDEHKPSRPPCVIKQMFYRKADSDGKLAELFRQEAIRLDELGQHPQIPALYAYFEQNGRQYLVQEFIDGLNLDQELRQRGPFSESQIRQLLHDLLPVLHYIHTQQVIHRDIKPENIIRRQSDRRFVLVDFGASKYATADSFTKIGTKIGSRGYASPEQSKGHASFSSDLYSLGVTCINLLTGVSPIQLFNRQLETWEWKVHLKSPISDTLDRVLNRLLLIDPNKRHQSVAEVLQDLELSSSSDDVPSPNWDVTSVKTLPISVNKSTTPPANAEFPWACIRTLEGHDAWVRTVALTPDGKLLASGSGDKTVKLWSVETGELLYTLEGHQSWVRAIAISSDGRILASAGNDNEVLLWNLANGTLLRRLVGHDDWIRSLAFSQNGQRLISASHDQTMRLWDVESGTLRHTFSGHAHWVLAAAMSLDGHAIASGSRDQTIKLWHRHSRQCIHSLTGHQGEVLAVAFSPDSKLLVSGSADHTAKLWKVSNGKLLHTFTDHQNAVNATAFSPNGKAIVTASSDYTIRFWQTNNGQSLGSLKGHQGWVWSIAFSDDGNTLVSGSWDETIKIWRRLK